MQNTLSENMTEPVKTFSKFVMNDQEGKPLMEWDGILICNDKAFFCEAKQIVFFLDIITFSLISNIYFCVMRMLQYYLFNLIVLLILTCNCIKR